MVFFQPIEKELTKKWAKRLILWLGGIIILLLLDEKIKEGYWFKPEEIVIPFTHENIITALLIAILILVYIYKRQTGAPEPDGDPSRGCRPVGVRGFR